MTKPGRIAAAWASGSLLVPLPTLLFLAILPVPLLALVPIAWAGETTTASNASADQSPRAKKIVFVAGPKSHGQGEHDHLAGCELLAERLNKESRGVRAVVVRDGWPKDPKAFEGVDAIVVYADGDGANPMLGHLDEIDALTRRGVGLVVLHYALCMPDQKSGRRLRHWIGGAFERNWSVNPHWKATFTTLPNHPIAKGVKPFTLDDEWYYNMRFVDDQNGVTPILTAVPPDSTRRGPEGPYTGNAHVRAERGKSECLAWARTRPDAGRGFGLTGGHWHKNWQNDDFRTLVLNAILWTAKAEPNTSAASSPFAPRL